MDSTGSASATRDTLVRQIIKQTKIQSCELNLSQIIKQTKQRYSLVSSTGAKQPKEQVVV